jgi:pantoate--beta-alanine ligase
MSSRNRYLSPPERAQALVLSRALNAMLAAYQAGERTAARLLEIGREVIAMEPQVRIDYLTIVDPDTLLPLEFVSAGVMAAIAAHVGATRLIDNMLF